MSVLNGIETVLENFPAPNQKVGTKQYKTSECRLFEPFYPPSYFSQLKLDFILPNQLKLKVLFTQVLNNIETV